MEENKILTKGQKCSLFVRELFALNYEDKTSLNYLKQNVINKYINLKTEYPDESIENTIIRMISTNNDFLKGLNRDKDAAKKIVNDLFKDNSNTKEFKESLSDFMTFYSNGGTEDAYYSHKTSVQNQELEKESQIGEIHKSGVLDFNFVRNKLSAKTEFWKIKEAVAWLVCYSEKIAENSRDVLILKENGFVDKDKTFDNLVEKINSVALTQKAPFEKKSNNVRFAYDFNDAQSGEVDVMLWDEKRGVIVASSATRDRGVEVEGNQFFRHMIKTSIVSHIIKNVAYSHVQNKQGKERELTLQKLLSKEYVQKLVRSSSFNDGVENYIDSTINKSYRNDTENALYKNAMSGNEFTRDLILHRSLSMLKFKSQNEKLKETDGDSLIFDLESLHNNGYSINKEETLIHLEKMNGLIDYVYYGETASDKDETSLLAGLNSIAYRDNLRSIGRFKLDNDSCQLIMDNIGKRFNGISHSTKKVEQKAHEVIYDLFVEDQNRSQIVDFITRFSKTNVAREERECLYGTFSVFYNSLGDALSDVNSENIESMKDVKLHLAKGVGKFFGSSLNRKKINQLVDVILNDEKCHNVINILDNIQGNNSEVSKEFFKMESGFKYFEKSKDEMISVVDSNVKKKQIEELTSTNDALMKEIESLKKELGQKEENNIKVDEKQKKRRSYRRT